MKNKIILTLCMSLPLWLAACGGSSSFTPEPTPGISSGTITGFGSVFVNGVKFNTDNATVTRGDDTVNDVRELEIGMVVRVQGDIQNRTASSVSFEEDVKGPADGPAIGNTFSVMGQTIITDAATVFNNISQPSDIVKGDILEISGLRNADDDIVAHFVEKKADPANVKRYSVTGNVRNLNTNAMTFNIDDLLINYTFATLDDFATGDPVEGQLVEVKDEVKTYVAGLFTLDATKVEPQNRLGDGGVAGAEVEIESIVTQLISASEFKIGDLRVQTSTSTRFLFGTADNIIPGVRLEVEGVLDASGVLQASKIKFEDNDARIQARVDDGGVNTADNTVTLLGITVNITSATDMEDNRDKVLSFSLADIADGDFLEIKGFIGANGAFVASELRRDSDDSKAEIRGPVSVKDPAAGSVTILGVTVNTDSSTELEGLNDERLTASQFFDAIIEGLTVVEAKWDPFTDTSLAAKELELED